MTQSPFVSGNLLKLLKMSERNVLLFDFYNNFCYIFYEFKFNKNLNLSDIRFIGILKNFKDFTIQGSRPMPFDNHGLQ